MRTFPSPAAARSLPPELSETILSSLNAEQRAAASHGSAPLLIVAGAGTGKTATLAHRVAYLIANGTHPQRVLLLTFTRRAAGEMKRRVDSLLRQVAAQQTSTSEDIGLATTPLTSSGVWSGTFHAIAARLLHTHGADIGLAPDFTILDRGDAEDLMHVARTSLELGRGAKRFPQKSTCLDIYARCIDTRQPLKDVLTETFPWCKDDADELGRLFSAYVDLKEIQHVLDYDDLLLFWHALLADPAAGARVRARFDAVLVDEFQDTNALQAEIIALLRPDGTGITAVGDDAQAIYGFRAASVKNILEFPQRFEGSTVLTLTRNYRSTQPLLDATNAIIAQSPQRYDKTLWTKRLDGARPLLVTCNDEPEQTDYVIDRILEHRELGTSLKQQAVLFRAAHHSAALELELARRNVPFVKYGGLKFLEMAHVKDLVSYLRLADNPRDTMAGLRVLQLIPGLGPKTAASLMDSLADAGGDFDTWVSWQAPEAASHTWPQFVTLMRNLAHAPRGDVSAQLHATRLFLSPLVEQRYDNADARLADLEQIESLAGRFADRTRFLVEMTLDPPQWTGELAGPPMLDEDYLVLSTMHSAKGLEFDCVYVIHAADGNIPSDMATGSQDSVEEERRLFYVACTRAKRSLYVLHPLRYYKVGRGATDAYGYAQRTRFIPDPLRALFTETQARPLPEGSDENGGHAVSATNTASIRAGVKTMWE